MKLFRCRRCLYPSTKVDIWFDDTGLCSACQAFDKRLSVDWSALERKFMDVVGASPGRTHDVIVACSGGKDSTWQILKCIQLGLRPLAVTASTDHLSAIGRRNLDNISTLCDHIEVTPHKPTRRKISRFALQEVGDISWCEHHLIWSVPAREAVARGIPIVLYGECPQNEYGAGPAGSENGKILSKAWVDEFGGLLGLRLSDLSDILDIEARCLDLYRYPTGDVSAIFMGAFFEWDGYRNAKVAREHGFEWSELMVEGTGHRYENLDNAQTGLHDHLRWLKFGYGRTCDIMSSHIRRGRVSREEGARAAWHYDGVLPSTYLGVTLGDVLHPLGLTYHDYQEICARFTNKPVVEWASQLGSYQSFYSTSMDASKDSGSITAAA